MKKSVIFLLVSGMVALGSFALAGKTKVNADCTFNGKKLFGKVQFVETSPDIKVKSVEAFPDLNVKMVNSFPEKCGEWQSVDSFPDLKVQLVESFPDVTIRFVDSFPGLP